MAPIRIALVLAAAFASVAVAGCGSSGDDPAEYAQRVAKEKEPKHKREINVFRPTAPRGTHAPCDALLSAEHLTGALGRNVVLLDKWNSASNANAVCIVIEKAAAVEHEAAADSADDAIGKTVGLEDAQCRIEATCHAPLDEPALRRRCERDVPGGISTEVAGSAACLTKQSTKDRGSKLMESGRVEHVKYRITVFEPDTQCEVDVYALDDEQRARACAQSALETITRESVAGGK